MRRVSHGKLEQRGDYYLCYATEEGHHTAEPPAADAHPTALVLAIPIALPPSPLPSVANGRRDWVYSRWPIARRQPRRAIRGTSTATRTPRRSPRRSMPSAAGTAGSAPGSLKKRSSCHILKSHPHGGQKAAKLSQPSRSLDRKHWTSDAIEPGGWRMRSPPFPCSRRYAMTDWSQINEDGIRQIQEWAGVPADGKLGRARWRRCASAFQRDGPPRPVPFSTCRNRAAGHRRRDRRARTISGRYQ